MGQTATLSPRVLQHPSDTTERLKMEADPCHRCIHITLYSITFSFSRQIMRLRIADSLRSLCRSRRLAASERRGKHDHPSDPTGFLSPTNKLLAAFHCRVKIGVDGVRQSPHRHVQLVGGPGPRGRRAVCSAGLAKTALDDPNVQVRPLKGPHTPKQHQLLQWGGSPST